MATNGDELDVVEPDWLEIESRQIDALGPKFAALVDTLMREMGGVPEKREEVRRCLYHELKDFGDQAGLYHEIANAKPREWLKRVHRAAKALKDLLALLTLNGRQEAVLFERPADACHRHARHRQ